MNECPFCLGNLGQRTVMGVCGISKRLAISLAELGYNKAYILLAQFLMFRTEDEFFIEWLRGINEINDEDAQRCSSCIRYWCTIHL
jgi:hypothetical protein